MYNVIILFGVSGCGKSLIGNQLSKDLQFEFIEGDDFHSNENIKKMKKNNINLPIANPVRELSQIDKFNDNFLEELNKGVYVGGNNVDIFENELKNFLPYNPMMFINNILFLKFLLIILSFY